MSQTPVAHQAEVRNAPRGCRQPWVAECPCGWMSASYAADHAAQTMAEHHNATA